MRKPWWPNRFNVVQCPAKELQIHVHNWTQGVRFAILLHPPSKNKCKNINTAYLPMILPIMPGALSTGNIMRCRAKISRKGRTSSLQKPVSLKACHCFWPQQQSDPILSHFVQERICWLQKPQSPAIRGGLWLFYHGTVVWSFSHIHGQHFTGQVQLLAKSHALGKNKLQGFHWCWTITWGNQTQPLVTHVLVTSRLDYCHVHCIGLPLKTVQNFQIGSESCQKT